jgi:hypothetical protein
MSGYEIDPKFVNVCGCLGAMYGEPYCPCEMRRRGLPSSPEHIAANAKSNEDMKKLFEPGGFFYEMRRDSGKSADPA